MLLSIAAVALSTALLIVVASLFNGFINAYEQSAVDGMGDVVLSPGKNFAGYAELEKRLEEIKSVEAATATLSAQGLLHLGRGNVRAVEIWGIEPAKFGKVTAFERSLLKGGAKKVPLRQQRSGQADTFFAGYVGIGVLAEPNEKTDEYDVNNAESMIGQQFVITTGSTSLPSIRSGQAPRVVRLQVVRRLQERTKNPSIPLRAGRNSGARRYSLRWRTLYLRGFIILTAGWCICQ